MQPKQQQLGSLFISRGDNLNSFGGTSSAEEEEEDELEAAASIENLSSQRVVSLKGILKATL